MIIIDANVFAKLFIEEHDSAIAREFFKKSIETDTVLLAPSLFSYEVLQIAAYYQHPFAHTLELLHDYQAYNLELIELKQEHWLAAEKLIATGHKNSGSPSLYDSSYHALAIEKEGFFLTADKRHMAKTKSFGHIKLLKHWNELF